MRWIWLALLIAGCQPETRLMKVHCRDERKHFDVVIKGNGPTAIQHAMRFAVDVCEGKKPLPTPGMAELNPHDYRYDMGDPTPTYSPMGE
jgi:hypothetical protein